MFLGLSISILGRAWKLFAAVALIIGLVVTFYPKVDVSTVPPLNPHNILLTPFAISNDGFLSINNVEILASFNKNKNGQWPHLYRRL
jgi:hypothetical protein